VEDFVGAEFYCPHALANGNQCVRIREKMLEFCSTVLSTLSSYHHGHIKSVGFLHINFLTAIIR